MAADRAWRCGRPRGGPILYAQERMGLDGRVFRMFKFRSMAHGRGEPKSGPVWTRAKDSRVAPAGLVPAQDQPGRAAPALERPARRHEPGGPAPRAPVFIEQFRSEIPGYMLRHKVKAGLTGWAQIHGWRGNTSLHERVEHDIYYIQNWTLSLDLRILFMTFWRGWVNRNAY